MLQVRKKFNSNCTAAHICQNQNKFFRSVFVNTFHFYNILLVLAIQLILHFYFTGKDRKWRKASKKLSGFLLEKILGWIQLRQCPTGPELRTSRRSRWLQLLKGSVHNTDKNRAWGIGVSTGIWCSWKCVSCTPSQIFQKNLLINTGTHC